MNDCIFCRLIAGDIPASIVYQDELTVAFMDIGQVNPGHVLVASRRHASDLLALTADEAAAAMRSAHRIAGAVKQAFNPPGMMLLQTNGAAGDQTVFHFHIHLLPRHESDGVSLAWPKKNPPRTDIDDYAAQLRAALCGGHPTT